MDIMEKFDFLSNFMNDDEVKEIRITENGNILTLRNNRTENTCMTINSEQSKEICNAVQSYIDFLKAENFYNSDDYNNQNIISTILPNGMRFDGVLHLEGVKFKAPFFTLRKYVKEKIDFSTLKKNGTITQKNLDILLKAIVDNKNILVVGQNSTGKTSLLNACLKEIESNKNNKQSIAIIQNIPMIKTQGNIELNLLSDLNKMNKAISLLSTFKTDKVIVDDLQNDLAFYELIQLMNNGKKGVIFSIQSVNINRGLSRFNSYLDDYLYDSEDYTNQIIENIDLVVLLYKDTMSEIKISLHQILDYNKESKEFIIQKLE